jgi:hypothetical protein
MTTLSRLTECPTAQVVLFTEADESPGPAAARGFDPADSRPLSPARRGADPGRLAPVAVLEIPTTGTRRQAATVYGARMASVRHAGCSAPLCENPAVCKAGPPPCRVSDDPPHRRRPSPQPPLGLN